METEANGDDAMSLPEDMDYTTGEILGDVYLRREIAEENERKEREWELEQGEDV